MQVNRVSFMAWRTWSTRNRALLRLVMEDLVSAIKQRFSGDLKINGLTYLAIEKLSADFAISKPVIPASEVASQKVVCPTMSALESTDSTAELISKEFACFLKEQVAQCRRQVVSPTGKFQNFFG